SIRRPTARPSARKLGGFFPSAGVTRQGRLTASEFIMNIEAIAYLSLGFGLPTLFAIIIVGLAMRGTRDLDATLKQVGVYK
ncbi:hypothetical protein, partial [Enterobacter cloacae]|uniref:hypothetical protein n=1 Tax=Enterobacter cloacae TaxID=550 RepID=UPI001952E1F4